MQKVIPAKDLKKIISTLSDSCIDNALLAIEYLLRVHNRDKGVPAVKGAGIDPVEGLNKTYHLCLSKKFYHNSDFRRAFSLSIESILFNHKTGFSYSALSIILIRSTKKQLKRYYMLLTNEQLKRYMKKDVLDTVDYMEKRVK